MAFRYHEYDGLVWSVSDRIPLPHAFTARLGGVGESPYAGARPEEERREELLARIRDSWLRLSRGGGFPDGIKRKGT